MDDSRAAVAATGLLTAAMRAEESAGDNPLFIDPFAERLAEAFGADRVMVRHLVRTYSREALASR